MRGSLRQTKTGDRNKKGAVALASILVQQPPCLPFCASPKTAQKKRSPRFHTSSVSLASLIARIIVSTSRKSFSSIELSITSMRLLHPLASLLRLISRPISWKSNLRSSRSNRIDITKCNFTFQVLVFERFIFSYYYIFNSMLFR